MSEDVPTLMPSGTELYQWATAINVFLPLLQRSLAANRERDGRMAYSDAEQAELEHLARQVPPLRPMSDDEQVQWQQRVPADMATQVDGEPYTVWWAQLDDEASGWGVEARTYSPQGAPTGSLFVVCRDPDDAAALVRWVHDNHKPDDLGRLHDLASNTAWGATEGPRTGGWTSTDPHENVLSENDWAEALRRNMPGDVGERLVAAIAEDHPEHPGWRQLYELADYEVTRVSADPDRLAAVIHRTLSTWRDYIHTPAGAAFFVLNQARELPRYEDMVRKPSAEPAGGEQPQETPGTTKPGTGPSDSGESESTGVMVVDGEVESVTAAAGSPVTRGDLRSPEAAMKWAKSLDRDNTEHRLAAHQAFPRCTPAVAAELASKYPGLVQRTKDAAKAEQKRRAGAAVGVSSGETASADEVAKPTLASLAADVERLNPASGNDKHAALMMVRHVPDDINALIAEKFRDDPKISRRLASLYPEGVPLASVLRARAEDAEQRAAAHLATPDDPGTPEDERTAASDAASTEQHAADTHTAAAAATDAARPAVLRQTVTPPRGRTR